MIRALDCLSIPNNTAVMVHSSFHGLSREGLTPITVAQELATRFETLLMPAMSWRFVKPGCNFDPLATPSNTGILGEVFRKNIADRRSLHPTHSVSGVGRRATELLYGHNLDDTPCSMNSPFGQLIEEDGWVLLLGIGMDCCTLIHVGEEVVAKDVYLSPEEYSYTVNGRSVRCRHHKTLNRDYWQFQDRLAREGKLRISHVGNVCLRAFRASNLHQIVLEALQKDPRAIIAKDGGRYRRM